MDDLVALKSFVAHDTETPYRKSSSLDHDSLEMHRGIIKDSTNSLPIVRVDVTCRYKPSKSHYPCCDTKTTLQIMLSK